MNCQHKHLCSMYVKKKDYSLAKKKYPKIDNPLERWECHEEFEKTCKDFKPFLPKMTKEEYANKRESILKDIPNEFKFVISSIAWEQGRDEGYEETIGILENIVSNFEKPIRDFEQRIRYATRNEERADIAKEKLDIP